MSSPAMLQGDQWKDIALVERWKAQHRENVERRWGNAKKPPARVIDAPLLQGTAIAAVPSVRDHVHDEARELIQWESESLTDRAHRLEPKNVRKVSADQARHQVPAMIGKDDADSWVISPALRRATDGKLRKAKRMFEAGLEKKAQREIACGILGGEVHCTDGHSFRVAYECGNRYCTSCGPRDANRLFAKQHGRLLFVATRLMLCGVEDCAECSAAIEEKRVPHWPPPRGHRPRVVCAQIDFMLRHDKDGKLPAPDRMRELNRLIKKFCRALEKRFGISRKEYGLAYCDELGGNNSNPHAHGIYVGPWLTQTKKGKELSELWREVTGDSFILSIKYAPDFSRALYHAVKYPAKFATRSTPERLADLESVFHRVRRFHTLAAFYAPECPAEEKPPRKNCPLCDKPLSEPRGFETIEALMLRGLQDLETVRARLAKERGLSGDLSPPK
jgi:hypothetical protein